MKLSRGKRWFFLIGLLTLMAATTATGDTGPDTVVLDSLADRYEPVNFNHAMHVGLVDGKCAKCHHHATGSPPLDPRCLKCHKGGASNDLLACRDCHLAKPFEADSLAALAANSQLYHNDKPGLKGAYHRNCLGCHQENGGPSGCQDCHARTAKGDEFFRSGAFAPKTAIGSKTH